MKLTIRTAVGKDVTAVFASFTRSLLEQLTPSFPPVKLVRFDGSRKGDEVHLELNFFLFKQRWESVISADSTADNECYFIDEGKKLPFFLSYWKHQHIIRALDENSCEIIDAIEYRTPLGWLGNWLLYPTLWLQFAHRKPIYQRIFGKREKKK